MGIDEQHEEEVAFALSLLLKKGVLDVCEHHEDAIFCGNSDVQEAYKLANYMFTNKKNETPFSERQEMIECIHSVYQDNSGVDSCQYCARYFED